MKYIFVCPDNTERMEAIAQKIKEYNPIKPVIVSSPLAWVMSSARALGVPLGIEPESSIITHWFDNTPVENARSAKDTLNHLSFRLKYEGGDTIILIAKGRELYFTTLEAMAKYLPNVPIEKKDFFYNRGDANIIDTDEKKSFFFKKQPPP